MCLNFLGMIHLDSHITSRSALGVETQFTQVRSQAATSIEEMAKLSAEALLNEDEDCL